MQSRGGGGGPINFGIAIPQIFTAEPVNIAQLKDFLARAESLGYHSCWVQEQTLGVASSLEPLALLSYAAALTSRLRLGTAVLLINLRNPVQLAKSLSTLDHLSGGRLIVGIGLGGRTDLYPAFGLTAERRVRRFVEGVTVIKKLWTDHDTSYAGEFFRVERASMEPKPLQKPHPPIWMGAHHPAALRRAVRIGDGWIGAGSSSTKRFQSELQILHQHLADANRDPKTFGIAKRVYLAVDQNKARAERRLTEWFGTYYGTAELAKKVAIYGGEQECREKVGEIIAAGAELLLLNPVFDERHHVELLASAILQRF